MASRRVAVHTTMGHGPGSVSFSLRNRIANSPWQHFCGVPEHNVAASHLMAASFSGKELDDRETGAHWHYAVFGGIVVDPIGFALNLIYA